MSDPADWPTDPSEYRGCRTYVLDENSNHIARLDTVLWPPVGSVIELGNPNRDAVVLDVRLQLPLGGASNGGGAVIIVSTDDSGSEGRMISRNAAERFLAGPFSPRSTAPPSSSILRLTMIIWSLLPFLDRGRHLDPQETRLRIADRTILVWLATQGLDVAFVTNNEVAAQDVTDLFQRLEAVVGPREFKVQENGLAILLAYCNQGIQQAAQYAWGSPDV